MNDRGAGFLGTALRRLGVAVFAAAATLSLFLVLPILQTIGSASRPDLEVSSIDTVELPPPPPPPPEPLEEEPEPEEPPAPELVEQASPLDLGQLELALNPVAGEGLFGDFTVKLSTGLQEAGDGSALEEIFSLGDLDQRPRPIFQRQPSYPAELRRQGRQGTVQIVFTVDRDGRVADATVETSTDPAFERSALEAVKQWRFEPGTRNGSPVPFRMRVPITFNAA